jgi:hypothetical protein
MVTDTGAGGSRDQNWAIGTKITATSEVIVPLFDLARLLFSEAR